MNESGRSDRRGGASSQVEPADVLVVHDDVDLELGRLAGAARAAASRGTTGFARSRRCSVRPTSCVCESVSDGPGRGDPRDVG